MKDTEWKLNNEVSGKWFRKKIEHNKKVIKMLYSEFEKGKLTLRGFDKILKLGFSVANYEGRFEPNEEDIQVAMSLRMTDFIS